MITTNEKGSVEKRVTLIKRGTGNIQHVMLSDTLINKAENYHLQVDHYITNSLPGILQGDARKNLIRIMPRYAINVAREPAGGLGDGWVDNKRGRMFYRQYKFTPKNTFSIAGLCEQIAEYVRAFNHLINVFGANHGNYPVNNARIIASSGNYDEQTDDIDPYDVPNHFPEADVADYITVGFDASGHLSLNMSSVFLANFYIQLEPLFAKQIGLPKLIYNDVNFLSNNTNITNLFNGAGDTFAIASGAAAILANPTTLYSVLSIFNMDDRISIDIEITLPLSQTIDVLNGKESHTYLLSRFMINDYKHVETRVQQDEGVILTKGIYEDKLALGLHDLVQGAPEAHTTKLLPGKIRELTCRLVLRYRQFTIVNDKMVYSIKRNVFELDKHGLYDILLQFNKKV